MFVSGQADESEAKCKELEKAVNDYQSLLKEASHRYGALEDQYEGDKAGTILMNFLSLKSVLDRFP